MEKINTNKPLSKAVGSWKAIGLGIATLVLFGLVAVPAARAQIFNPPSDTPVITVPVPAALAQAHTITTLASFNDSYGGGPSAGLALGASTLYGTTQIGGAYEEGAVFLVPKTGGKVTVLASLKGPNGGYPYAALTLNGSTVYGTTAYGGVYGYGKVFSMSSLPAMGGTLTVLASFNDVNGGGTHPQGSLTLIGSTIYGTTIFGGANTEPNGTGDGTVFSVSIKGGTPIVLATFNGARACYAL